MKFNGLFLFVIPTLLLVASASYPLAFAQSTYEIRMPTGSSVPNASHYWESQKDGSTTGEIEIIAGDSVMWSNADTAAHTVTSGTPEKGPDGIFDSGLMSPGESFIQKFDNVGSFPYYCIIHPWMDGVVYVVEGFQIIPDVGAKVSNGDVAYDVEYKFNRVVSLVSVNVDQKSITFELVGRAKSDDHTLIMNIPSGLIGPPFVVWVDGTKVDDFTTNQKGDINTMSLSLSEKNKVLTLVGTSIVPEFGSFAVVALALSVVGVVVLSSKYRYN